VFYGKLKGFKALFLEKNIQLQLKIENIDFLQCNLDKDN